MQRKTSQKKPPSPVTGLVLLAMVATTAVAGCASTGQPQPAAPQLTAGEVDQLRLQMAERLVERRDYEHALPYIRSLLQQHPNDLRLRLMLAEVLRERGMYQAALRELALLLKHPRPDAEVHAAHGVLLDEMGRHAKAEQHHRRAVKLSPTDPRYHNNLGFCLFLQRRLDKAKQSFIAAISLDPGFRRAFNNLGFVYGLSGDREKARETFLHAGSEALVLTNLGLVEEMRGQPLLARKLYERALKAQPGYRPAQRNLNKIDAQVETTGRGAASNETE